MKFQVSALEFATALGRLVPIVPIRLAIPITANLLLEAKEAQIVLSVTDLNISLRLSVPATVEEPGAIVLPARRLTFLARELTASPIEVIAEAGDIAHICCGPAFFQLHGIHKSEFPTLPSFTSTKGFTVLSSTWAKLLTQVSFAIAKEDSRHALNAVHMEVTGNEVTLTGTNGKKLARITASFDINGDIDGSYLIPPKAVEEMVRLCETPQELHFFVENDRLALEGPNECMMTQLLVGEYPDPTHIIPQTITSELVLHKEELLILLRQVTPFLTEEKHSVRFHFEDNTLTLTTMKSEIGEGRVSMPVDYAKAAIDMAFNPYSFMEILKHCQGETVTLGLNGPFDPSKISDGTEAIFVLMPMRFDAVTAA